MTKLYLVERLVIEYQYIAANSEEEAIQDALDCAEWDREAVGQGDELFYGVRAEFKGEA
ncbi:hypothetical protein AB9_118 [Acinetobacter phage vB_AbaM_B9]|nr:hypothetical protein AB9_118 [Acinetobacter phage vB_AbaM_B9]